MAEHASLLQTLSLALRTHFTLQTQLLQHLCAAQRERHRRRLRARRQIILRLIRGRRPPVAWAHPRAHHWWDVVVPGFTSAQFIHNFRVSPESFDYICSRLSHALQRKNTNYRLCVPVRKRVAIAIWKLATNSEYRAVSHLFGVGISTVFNCVQDFCSAVIEVLLPEHITFPDTGKLVEMASYFSSHWGVPQCVGAVDISHIPIKTPEEYPRDYFNRKGWHSVILQAVVDGKGLFWDVCVGYPGSVHATQVLQQSQLWEKLSDGQLLNQNKMSISGRDIGHYLLGDPAYPLQAWLMKPFSDTGRLTTQQQIYNYSISGARSVVEMAFGRLKGRWRCLLKRSNCNLKLTKKMVLACCVLHNICEERGDHFREDLQTMHVNVEPPLQVLPEQGQPEGATVRAVLMDYFSWQEQ
ncbi:protein ANTAGONIST OF LIKE HETEROCHROMATIN PROTEIN 1 [Archocentrus centrarchus]|uniref:protein ANTAGONIST OF LIKE HETEROCHROMATIN PROTEIN 1 n=1 Tax=Archocentrus centrarchus TaxID=63155 RepID=UPI0011EA11F9|nr:protein ANTAGONIST OF LIKE HETEROCHROMATIN PROTEIN 1-like [Archocentrus centrarchus]